MRATSQDNVVREPMSDKLGRLPSAGFWIVITLLVAVLVICLLGSIIGLMVEPQSPHLTTVLMHLTTLLMSEFLWGVIVGLLLSVAGAYCLAVFTTRQHRKAQKDMIKNFCIDTIDNIKAIVDDMVDHRQRTQVIHKDYLALLDIEFNVFSKNREHIIHLPNPVRDNVRKFVNDCAIRRAEIGNHLFQFNNSWTHANQLHTRGQMVEAQRVRKEEAEMARHNADQALGQLVVRVKDSADLVNSLKGVR
jgi:hypothetical protein